MSFFNEKVIRQLKEREAEMSRPTNLETRKFEEIAEHLYQQASVPTAANTASRASRARAVAE